MMQKSEVQARHSQKKIMQTIYSSSYNDLIAQIKLNFNIADNQIIIQKPRIKDQITYMKQIQKSKQNILKISFVQSTITKQTDKQKQKTNKILENIYNYHIIPYLFLILRKIPEILQLCSKCPNIQNPAYDFATDYLKIIGSLNHKLDALQDNIQYPFQINSVQLVASFMIWYGFESFDFKDGDLAKMLKTTLKDLSRLCAQQYKNQQNLWQIRLGLKQTDKIVEYIQTNLLEYCVSQKRQEHFMKTLLSHYKIEFLNKYQSQKLMITLQNLPKYLFIKLSKFPDIDQTLVLPGLEKYQKIYNPTSLKNKKQTIYKTFDKDCDKIYLPQQINIQKQVAEVSGKYVLQAILYISKNAQSTKYMAISKENNIWYKFQDNQIQIFQQFKYIDYHWKQILGLYQMHSQ